jgi:two-component system OmpR family response regulator/two-component system torCAD operon response regulator TorR
VHTGVVEAQTTVQEAPEGRRKAIVVEDVDVQREAVTEYFRKNGFEVDAAQDGASFRRLCAANRYDLAIVDLHLPDEDGMDLVRLLRDTQACGIIVLTGNDDPTDRIVGLEVGADDFLVKPHMPRELLARARSVLRRMTPAAAQPPAQVVHEQPTLGEWRLEVGARALGNGKGGRVDLTPAEFTLMRELLNAGGSVLSREHLMMAVYNRTWEYEDRSIDVLVARLRPKLFAVGIADRLKSVRTQGYYVGIG